MRDIIGKALWILAFFYLLLVLFTITTAEDEMLDRRALFADMCNFVDGVVDSGEVTEAELRQFNADIATYGYTLDYEIERYIRSVDPDPLNPGEYIPTWIRADYTGHFNQGDKIVLHVWSIGQTPARTIARHLIPFYIEDFDRRVPARVR